MSDYQELGQPERNRMETEWTRIWCILASVRRQRRSLDWDQMRITAHKPAALSTFYMRLKSIAQNSLKADQSSLFPVTYQLFLSFPIRFQKGQRALCLCTHASCNTLFNHIHNSTNMTRRDPELFLFHHQRASLCCERTWIEKKKERTDIKEQTWKREVHSECGCLTSAPSQAARVPAAEPSGLQTIGKAVPHEQSKHALSHSKATTELLSGTSWSGREHAQTE